MPRFFIEGAPCENRLVLTGEQAHHAARVLRLRVGEALTLCDGCGTDYHCTVEQAGGDAVTCLVQQSCPSAGEPRQDFTLLMALPKADKFEFVVQKSVELGVSRIVPFVSQNCAVKPGFMEKKLARWQKIAEQAACQCGRGKIPPVSEIVDFAAALSIAAKAETRLFCYEHERQTGLSAVLADGLRPTVSVMIGAEGGFTPEEAGQAVARGLCSVSLGTRILRCETVPLTVLSILLYAGQNMS